MRDARRDKPSGRRAEDELERVTGLPAYAQTPALVQDGNDRAALERAAEVGDARAGAHARDGSRRSEHRTMVVPRGSPGGMSRRTSPAAANGRPTATAQSHKRAHVRAWERLRIPCGRMRRTKIVATIGPASREPDTLLRMVQAGMDVARLNYSHGTLEEHAETVRRVRDAAGRAGRPVAILQDLPGPKLRIGALREDVVELTAGERLTITGGETDALGDAQHMSITWEGLADSMSPGEVLYLADGSVRLRVVEVRASAHEVEAEIEIGGAVASRQGLNIPGPVESLPSVPEHDLELLRHGESIGVDMVALSFVQRPEDVETVRAHTRLPLIAKMEKPQAVERADEIVRAADCVMVARGDLGIELRDRARADRTEAAAAPRRAPGAPVDHGDADARLDGHLLAPHPRGGRRRRQRDSRRHGRRDALPGDGDRRLPGRGDRDDGLRRRAGRGDRAV